MELNKKCNYCGYKTNDLKAIHCPDGDLMIQTPIRICSCGGRDFKFEHMHEDTGMEEVASVCIDCGKEQ